MDKFFNTAGPIIPAHHYHLPVMGRLEDDDLFGLIHQMRYFVLHAPRQTGKTSALLGLCDELNQGDEYDAVYMNVEGAQAYREQVDRAMKEVLGELARRVRFFLNDEALSAQLLSYGDVPSLAGALSTLSLARSKPVVLFIDEIDTLIGDTLIAVLRQLRSGYDSRPSGFPISIVLCGVRDVREYRIHSGSTGEIISGGSCFNIKAESLTMSNFDEPETRELLLQHTSETGQVFEDEALNLAWHYSHGQPWLVNALGKECCFSRFGTRDRGQPITDKAMAAAKDRLVRARATHLDQLVDKLKEGRVFRVMHPIVAGTEFTDATEYDLEYVLDLGLIRRSSDGMVISNAIYREIIPRVLNHVAEVSLENKFQRLWFVADDGTLKIDKLLHAFVAFFRENSEAWVERFQYKEAGPQLLLQAFLQRIVNGGGRIDREYGLGRMRTDLLVQWPLDPEQGFLGPVQRVVIELKLLHKSLRTTIAQGLRQTHDYVQRTGAADAHLLVFDRRTDVAWDKKVFRLAEQHDGLTITVWGM